MKRGKTHETSNEIMNYLNGILCDIEKYYPKTAPKIIDRINIALPSFIDGIVGSYIPEHEKQKTNDIIEFKKLPLK